MGRSAVAGGARARILLGDPHPIVLKGLDQLLAENGDYEVCGLCDSAETLLAAVEQRPDIVLVDPELLGKDGLERLRDAARAVGLRVVLYTTCVDAQRAIQAVRYGFYGIVPKRLPPALLLKCLDKVRRGGTWLETESVKQALEMLVEGRLDRPAVMISPAERAVLRFVIQGLRNKEIAERLNISESTVRSHLHKTYAKLGVSRRADAARAAQERSLI